MMLPKSEGMRKLLIPKREITIPRSASRPRTEVHAGYMQLAGTAARRNWFRESEYQSDPMNCAEMVGLIKESAKARIPSLLQWQTRRRELSWALNIRCKIYSSKPSWLVHFIGTCREQRPCRISPSPSVPQRSRQGIIGSKLIQSLP